MLVRKDKSGLKARIYSVLIYALEATKSEILVS